MAELRVKGTGTLKLFESDNTSSVTIASPASLSADKTITLPDADVTLVSGTMATTNGITAASQWRLTTNFTGDAAPIDSNWEEVDTDGYATLGSSMTESSGIYTFPSTGYWLITFKLYGACDDDEDYLGASIHTSTNGGAGYSQASASYSSLSPPTTFSMRYQTSTCSFMFDVTSTSNCKVKFEVSSESDNGITVGGSASNYTCVTFVRLGDT